MSKISTKNILKKIFKGNSEKKVKKKAVVKKVTKMAKNYAEEVLFRNKQLRMFFYGQNEVG